MEDFYVFCGFFWKLIYDFYLSEATVQNCNLAERAPAGVGPLEVRFAHPVRLSPATHSQGHGRPCLQRLHPRRGFSATWSLLMDISMIFDSPCAIKRFLRTSWWKMNSVCAKNVLMFTPTRELHSKSPDGDGGWSRHWLPKRGDPRSGEDRRNSPSPPWLLLSRAQFLNKSVSCELTN